MDEVNDTRDRIHETMDEVISLKRLTHATRNGVDPTKLRVFGSNADKHALDRRKLLNHGFTQSPQRSARFIHGFNLSNCEDMNRPGHSIIESKPLMNRSPGMHSDKRHALLLTFSSIRFRLPSASCPP